MTPRTPGSRAFALRAGAIAVAIGLLIPGGAYAAVTTTSASSQKAGQTTAVKDDSGIASLGSAYEAASAASASTEEALVVEDVTEAHGSSEEETDQLPKGEKKVKTAGADGVTRVTYRVTTDADGVEASREVVSSVVVTAKVDEVVLVGTKEAKDAAATPSATPTAASSADSSSGSSTSAAALADDGSLDDDFQRLAQCESGGNPRAVNPAGYYGLYQFSLDTWASVGGTGNPIDASPEEQTMRAKMLQQRSGWSQWGCGH